MRDWLTIELVLATLLVTSFTCVGMLALWAATSRRHWFIRTAAVLVALSPLLFIPANELFATFVIQSAVVACGVTVYRWRAAPNPANRSSANDDASEQLGRFRFSLSTLLLLMVLVAICASIAIQLPKNTLEWTTVAASGIAGGLGTLAGIWLYAAKRKLIVWPIACLLCIAIGRIVSELDWFFESVLSMSGWPPKPITLADLLGDPNNYHPFRAWTYIPLLVALLSLLLVFSWSAAVFPRERDFSRPENRSPRRRLAGAIFILLALVIAGFPLAVLLELLLPAPIPKTNLPVPNAYTDLETAANIASTQFNGTIDRATADWLSTEVTNSAKVFELVAEALDKPCWVPVNYSSSVGRLSIDELNKFRGVGLALHGKGRLAELEGRNDDAAECYLQAIRFGYAACRGRLLNESLFIRSCAGYGTGPLHRARNRLSTNELDRCLAALVRLDANDEPLDDIRYRERVWGQRSNGWHGHLRQLLLADILGDDDWDNQIYNAEDYQTVQATIRLLICELALSRFHQDNAHWPTSLDELVPKFLAAVPTDPLDPQRMPLKYRLIEGDCVVYSVGRNRVDDGGVPPPKGDQRYEARISGDLLLDALYPVE